MASIFIGLAVANVRNFHAAETARQLRVVETCVTEIGVHIWVVDAPAIPRLDTFIESCEVFRVWAWRRDCLAGHA